ncbi:MAG TPA: hypothetical protein PLJ47_07415 [Candidatus Hydrogenedentes bacterium]|nr:hypothetical protein [Candidatus Hydrogenedentota bacterium]HRK34409.1 hypothetical protein [Candidatus Hydrogenedentota bacterium]
MHDHAAVAAAILIILLLLLGWARRNDEAVGYVSVIEPLESVRSDSYVIPPPYAGNERSSGSGLLAIPVMPPDPETPAPIIVLPESLDNLVWILCHPVADVYVDHEYVGESPRPKPFLVSAGTHTIQVIPKGDVSARRFDVTLAPDKPYVIEVLLDEGHVAVREGIFPCEN